jgi:hypothetical protein
MKSVASILLLVLAFTAFLPCSPVLVLTDRDCQSTIGALDVCHSSVPAIASGGEMP